MIDRIKKGTPLVVFAAVLGLSSCEDYNPDKNTFEVVGRVTDAGKKSLKAEISEVTEAEGKANDWFSLGNEHQIHDNCNCAWGTNKKYGIVLNYSGVEIETSDVDEGSCVNFQGKIREIDTDDGATYRPVYDVARIVDC